MSRDIYDQARHHFFDSGKSFEYGRPDMALPNKSENHRTDPSRTEQDNDHDGKLGVDCSSFVWRGLKEAGYGVPAHPFTTRELFQGHTVTPYAQSHFDVIPGAEARKPHGSLQPGDVVLFSDKHGSGQHVGIVRDYDANGHLRFIGSQVRTGPGEQTVQPGGYWDGKNMEIVGALRAKPEFRIHAPPHDLSASLQGNAEKAQAAAPATILQHGAESPGVQQLQQRLNAMGSTDSHGKPLVPDGRFGDHTREAVEHFQRSHGLEVDGKVGPHTRAALEHLQSHAPLRLDDANHPDHPLFRQTQDAVRRLDAQHGRVPDGQSDRVAGALVVVAKEQGLSQVDHVVMNDDASRVYAVQGDLNSPLKRIAQMSTAEALATPMEMSSDASRHVNQPPIQQSPTATQVLPPDLPAQSARVMGASAQPIG